MFGGIPQILLIGCLFCCFWIHEIDSFPREPSRPAYNIIPRSSLRPAPCYASAIGNSRPALISFFTRASLSNENKRALIRVYMAQTQKVSKTRTSQRSEEEQEQEVNEKEEIEKEWRLVLHDDTIHTIEEVVDIIATCVPLCPGPRAYDVTMEVHLTGAATVCISNKKLIEEYAKTLQAAGLTVSWMKDDEFQQGEGDGEGGESEGGDEGDSDE